MTLPTLLTAESTPGPSGANPPGPIPSALGRKVLAFVFVVLIEYWLAPVLFGMSDFAGIWSTAGYLMFGLLVGALAVFVLFPLSIRLGGARLGRRGWAALSGFVGGGVLLGLFATNRLVLGGSAVSGAGPGVGTLTVYTPFGAWPSLTFLAPSVHLSGTIDPEFVAILTLLSFLWASTIVLGWQRRRAACPSVQKAAPRGLRQRAALLAMWGPFGFLTGCSSCSPLYLAALAVVAPGAAASGYSALPLTPWIGLAGLLYIASFVMALHLLRRATDPSGMGDIRVPAAE